MNAIGVSIAPWLVTSPLKIIKQHFLMFAITFQASLISIRNWIPSLTQKNLHCLCI
jgi:hypothetical protein